MNEAEQYIRECRARIPEFVREQYSLRGARALNRHAWGKDILIAPYNFFMGMPNFVLKLLALIFEAVRLYRVSRFFNTVHFGMKTEVQNQLGRRLKSHLFGLGNVVDANQRRVDQALNVPIETYLQTRNVAADVTAGTFAAIVGLVLFNQFTPGSVSAGSVIADWAGKEHAASQFIFGETLGSVWYSVIPPETPTWLMVMSFAAVMFVVSVFSAFAGFIHDPVQRWTGIHQRRLHKLLDAVELQLKEAEHAAYRPKDTFVGRIYDVVDWVKGILP